MRVTSPHQPGATVSSRHPQAALRGQWRARPGDTVCPFVEVLRVGHPSGDHWPQWDIACFDAEGRRSLRAVPMRTVVTDWPVVLPGRPAEIPVIEPEERRRSPEGFEVVVGHANSRGDHRVIVVRGGPTMTLDQIYQVERAFYSPAEIDRRFPQRVGPPEEVYLLPEGTDDTVAAAARRAPRMAPGVAAKCRSMRAEVKGDLETRQTTEQFVAKIVAPPEGEVYQVVATGEPDPLAVGSPLVLVEQVQPRRDHGHHLSIMSPLALTLFAMTLGMATAPRRPR